MLFKEKDRKIEGKGIIKRMFMRDEESKGKNKVKKEM